MKGLGIFFSLLSCYSNLACAQLCKKDLILDSYDANERNHWAVRCNYMDKEDLEDYRAYRLYASFSDLYYTEVITPIDQNAPCDHNLIFLGACPIGGF